MTGSYRNKSYPLFVTAMFTLILLGLSFLMLPATAANQTNNTLQNWTLKNTQDEIVALADYQGKPVILVFWATWCPYCKKLLPGLEQLHQQYADKGLTILALNIKEDWKPKVYWRNHEYSFPALLEGDKVAQLYGIMGTPGVVFISPEGKVLKATYFSDPKHPLLTKFVEAYIH
ncbi:redoxin domain-containing protein [Thalassotalea ganghwensis]